MTITCEFQPVEAGPTAASSKQDRPASESEWKEKTKGHAVCGHCGAEADMWIDP